jgi:hypothetical protein
MKTVWRVFGYLKRYPLLAVGTLTCAVLGTFMVIIFPAVPQWRPACRSVFLFATEDGTIAGRKSDGKPDERGSPK